MPKKRENKGKMQRLGHGPYEPVLSGRTPSSVEHARNIFLKEVRCLAPSVLDDLANEPFELFRRTSLYFEADKNRLKRVKEGELIVDRYIWTEYERPSWESIESPVKNALIDTTVADKDGNIAAFRDRMFRWSRDHNLDVKWCRKRAYDTLDLWCYSPQDLDARQWLIDLAWVSIVPDDNPPKFVFEYSLPTYPRYGFRQDLELQIAGEFKKRLKAFLTELEEKAKRSGLKPTPRKRSLEHFAWLVEHHINGLGYDDIAEKYQDKNGLELSSVSEGITKTAALIRLPLLQKRGRSNHS